jgi:hypothetical protein
MTLLKERAAADAAEKQQALIDRCMGASDNGLASPRIVRVVAAADAVLAAPLVWEAPDNSAPGADCV